jgi:hypothetical protein
VVQAAASLKMGKAIWPDGPLGRAASVSTNRNEALFTGLFRGWTLPLSLFCCLVTKSALLGS